jgi:hypothetical protein
MRIYLELELSIDWFKSKGFQPTLSNDRFKFENLDPTMSLDRSKNEGGTDIEDSSSHF